MGYFQTYFNFLSRTKDLWRKLTDPQEFFEGRPLYSEYQAIIAERIRHKILELNPNFQDQQKNDSPVMVQFILGVLLLLAALALLAFVMYLVCTGFALLAPVVMPAAMAALEAGSVLVLLADVALVAYAIFLVNNSLSFEDPTQPPAVETQNPGVRFGRS